MQPPSSEEWIRDTFARRDEVLTREESERQMQVVLNRYREDSEAIKARMAALEEWRSNLMGRGVGLTIIGAIFVAVSSAAITRLIFGG